MRNKKVPKNVPESSQAQNCRSFVQIQGACARHNVFRRLNVVEKPRKKGNLYNTWSIFSGYYKLYLHRVIDLTTAYSID